MKKDRNTFFQEASYMSNMGIPNPNINMNTQPFATSSYANQGFYAGPIGSVPMNYNTGIPQNQNNIANYNNYDYSDIEARLSKIERQLNRLDLRLNKLENNNFYTTDDIDNTNVYMV